MQKTSNSSLSCLWGPGKPPALCLLLFVQGPPERSRLLPKDTGRPCSSTRFHQTVFQSLEQSEAAGLIRCYYCCSF